MAERDVVRGGWKSACVDRVIPDRLCRALAASDGASDDRQVSEDEVHGGLIEARGKGLDDAVQTGAIDASMLDRLQAHELVRLDDVALRQPRDRGNPCPLARGGCDLERGHVVYERPDPHSA